MNRPRDGDADREQSSRGYAMEETLRSKGLLPVLLWLALAAPAPAHTGSGDQHGAAALPVVRAVMFSSGVGYFEHAGTVSGDASLRLLFDKDQIDDVLKSLVATDLDGGQVTRASYPTKDPIGRTLASFAVDLSGKPALPQLLEQLRGVPLTVYAPEAVSGRILSVEKRARVVEDTRVTEHLLTLATAGGLRAVVLENVDRLRLEDPELENELDKALRTLAVARDTQRRPVTLRFEGEGERRVRVGYLVEAPVWKASYRLDLSGIGGQAGDEGQARLQGWALTQNMTASDWREVELSLVSGRPLAFTMDLYTPLYAERPRLQLPRHAALAPRLHGEGTAAGQSAEPLAQQRARNSAAAAAEQEVPGRLARALAPAALAAADTAGASSGAQVGDAVQARATAGSVGELFRFTLEQPVTLARRDSAMLPIVTEPVPAAKVSIYNRQQDAEHPMSGVELTNATGLTLPAGPVTVLDGGMYAGDALIEALAPGQRRLLGYAVDLSVTVDPSSRSTQRVLGARIHRGTLRIARRQDYSQTYRIENEAEEARTLILEHPFNSSRQLVEPKEPYEKTPRWYRFRVPVAAGATGAFTVKERRTYSQSIVLLDRPVEDFLAYTTTGDIDEQVRLALERAAGMKRELARLQRERERKREQIDAIADGQTRLRQNIDAVGRGSTLGKRYVQKLAEQEDRIETLQGERAALEDQIRAQEQRLADYLESLDVG